ncbi:MAG: hypothetical protein V3V52_11935, partial [Candidatus Adiutricales bacterium]
MPDLISPIGLMFLFAPAQLIEKKTAPVLLEVVEYPGGGERLKICDFSRQIRRIRYEMEMVLKDYVPIQP